jgi:elongation of very long chain fatty acids protein 6
LNYKQAKDYYFIINNSWIPVLAIFLYGLMITLGPKYFENKKPWNLRKTMAAWNLSLSVFSAIGFCRVLPMLIHLWTHYSFEENFCTEAGQLFGQGPHTMWLQAFVVSKIPELLDTFFIVVHKKPLIFLHWYHHVSVLAYCWHSFVTRAPHGIIFCAMNYFVHAIMYGYYFLMAAGIKPKAFKAVYITVAQISQMIVGVVVTLMGCYVLWFRGYEPPCMLSVDNNVAALLMYGSYLVLFVQFFLQRYFGRVNLVHFPMPKDKDL